MRRLSRCPRRDAVHHQDAAGLTVVYADVRQHAWSLVGQYDGRGVVQPLERDASENEDEEGARQE